MTPDVEKIFPLLLFILINANPAYFQWNLNFIKKFMPGLEMMGENGYILTSF